jgi:cyclic pyranopterin phosphate synthase
MPEKGVEYIPHEKILRHEEIFEFVKVAVNYGINKVRITGGEPLVRKGIIELIKMLSQLKEIEDLSLTTNGYFLEEKAEELKKAGIKRINISLDTLDPEKFKKLTRGGDLNKVLKGIFKAKEVGFNPIKLNVVYLNESSNKDIDQIKEFAQRNNFEIRIIKQMLLKTGIFSKVIGGEGGNCNTCNRLRLTAEGNLMPCLFSDIKFNIRELGYEKALLLAVKHKPLSGKVNTTREFYNIGG